MPIDLPVLLDRLCYRYPSFLVDAVVEHQPGDRLVAMKNVTVDEEYFQGHFPGVPLMPGVLLIESLVQASTLLLLHREDGAPTGRVHLRGVDEAKFRRQVVPGDRIRLEVQRRRVRGPLAKVHAQAYIDEQLVAEAQLLLTVVEDGVEIHPTAMVDPAAVIGAGTVVGANVTIGPNVRIGRACRIGASSVIDGWTVIGDGNQVSPMVSIGLPPQDLKYKGDPTRVVIGNQNTFREFMTVHRGTVGGGGITTIGDRNLFMAYSHVAHDCHVGNETIFGNAATLGGHVTVEDFATISAFSAVHQFCRVGQYAFIGGFSVITKDAMPYAKSVGNRARIYGLNTIGLKRRGFSDATLARLRRAYRYLLMSKLNTTRALAKIAEDPELDCPEVQYLVQYIRSSHRGVNLRRALHKAEDVGADE